MAPFGSADPGLYDYLHFSPGKKQVDTKLFGEIIIKALLSFRLSY